MSFLFIIVEITCQHIPKFKMSASLVTDKEIENFTLAVIQSEQLLQNNCIRIDFRLTKLAAMLTPHPQTIRFKFFILHRSFDVIPKGRQQFKNNMILMTQNDNLLSHRLRFFRF